MSLDRERKRELTFQASSDLFTALPAELRDHTVLQMRVSDAARFRGVSRSCKDIIETGGPRHSVFKISEDDEPKGFHHIGSKSRFLERGVSIVFENSVTRDLDTDEHRRRDSKLSDLLKKELLPSGKTSSLTVTCPADEVYHPVCSVKRVLRLVPKAACGVPITVRALDRYGSSTLSVHRTILPESGDSGVEMTSGSSHFTMAFPLTDWARHASITTRILSEEPQRTSQDRFTIICPDDRLLESNDKEHIWKATHLDILPSKSVQASRARLLTDGA